EEGLYILVRAYDKLGMTQLSDDAKRVLEQNYPQSTYLARGFGGADKPWWQLW
ncbi:MAG: outer membrane protein assembly factor BamD, partial [Proteobacteria bacterium]|nr:outer membrane protein assembly factor BamD [Pseudomonadota bacterium]